MTPSVKEHLIGQDIEFLCAQVGDEPDVPALMRVVQGYCVLNRKQFQAVYTMLRWNFESDIDDGCMDSQKQHPTHTGGIGGTGKTRVILAFMMAMEILEQDHTVHLMAPTGSAASNINGCTMYTALDLSMFSSGIFPVLNPRTRMKLQARYSGARVLVADEVSMCGKSMFCHFTDCLNQMRDIPAESSALFGGIPIVVVLGDFHQFTPVRAPPL